MESFGRHLERQRELRGLSRADVAKETRLSPLAIEALEHDRFEQLPAEAFVIGYLRSYAAAIGVSPDELVLRYQEFVGSAAPDETPQTPPRLDPRWAVGLGIGLALLLALILGWLL